MAAPDVSRLGELVLAWLLTRGEKRGARSELSRALRPFVELWWTAGEWSSRLDELLAGLERESLILRAGRGGLSLSPRGRTRALAWLGVERLARGTTWKQLKQRHLIARALELEPAGDGLKRLGDADGLVAALIKRQHGLPGADTPSLAQVRDRLLWKELGLETDRPFTLSAVRAVLLTRTLKSSREQPPEQALRQLAARAVQARRAEPEELRLAVVRSWLSPAAAPEPPPRLESSLDAFAHRVLDAARASPTGWFGDDKVFISHVYRALSAPLGLDERAFKQRLVEANRARLLSLSRADLVEAMDPADVAASEIEHLGSTFHFITL